MKTDDLIRALASDLAPPGPSIETRFVMAFAPGLLVALALFAVTLGPRGDLALVVGDMRFLFKFAVTLLLALCSALIVWRLARPGAPVRLQIAALASVPLIVAAGVLMELIVLPTGSWCPNLIGSNGLVCLVSIPFFAWPMLIAEILALRQGAPTRPALTGVVAGLIAGGVAAAIYAVHCRDDLPLFVALWYSLGIAIVALVGGLAGRLALRW